MIADKEIEEMIKLWKEGLSSVKIARNFNVHSSSVRYHLRKQKINTSRGYIPGKVTDKVKDRIRNMWKNNESTRVISKKLELSQKTILNHLRKMGIDTTTKLHKPVSEVIIKKMLKFWNEGYDCVKIGKILNVPKTTVRYCLNGVGIKTIRRPRKVTEEMIKDMKKLYKSGKSSIEISKEFNINSSTVLEYLHKVGVDTSRGKRKNIITKSILNVLINFWKQGLSGYEISRKTRIPVATVYFHLRKHVDTTHHGKYIPGKVNKNLEQKMIKLWHSGLSSGKIAKKLNLSKKTVLEHLKKRDMNTSERANKPLPPRVRKQVKNMYLRGISCQQIGKKLEISDWTVRKHLKLMKIKTDLHYLSPCKVKKRKLKEKIIELWNEGFSSWQIAEKLGLAKSTILYNLEKFGVDTSRGYEIDFETLRQKYELLVSILIKMFSRSGYNIFKISDYYKNDADILLKDSNGNVIPVEFKAEMAYCSNFVEGISQLTNYIKKWNASFGFLVTTANKSESLKVPKNIRVIWSNDLYRLFPGNKKDLDFIRYTPVKIPIQTSLK